MVRVYSNHVLERYPFFASTGIAREDVLAGWRDRTLGVVLSGLVLLGLLASSLYRLERAEARQAQAMTNLAESEHRHRDLVATIPGAVYEFRVDSTGRRSMPFVSKGIVELTGLSPEEIQADVEVTFRQVPAAAMPVMEQSIRDSLENLTPWLHEFPLQTTTGEDKWLRGHSIPRRDADGSTRWHGVFIDITARVAAEKALQESQARLASIIDSARDAIITVDETGRILVFNRAAETMFRCNAAGAVGQSLERFIPQRFHAAHRDYVRKFGATGASARAMGQAGDVSGLSADGEEFPVEAAISHVTVGGRQLFTVMLRDIVGRIAAAEKQRDVLVKEVHHRIKNNLQGVIGLMQQHAAAHSELKDLVERMVAQIRAIAVIHGMHSERTQGEIGLCELVTEISRATTVLTQIEIAADGPDDTSGAIRIPKDEAVPLALVLNELLFNAIKHGLKETGGGGGVRVSVSGHDGLARVRISNPGVLPAPDFDFAKGAGLGTGLNLVKSLLSRHGARLEIVQEGDQVVADLTLTDPAIICSS
jgi:PAS domain S-box-containing protein